MMESCNFSKQIRVVAVWVIFMIILLLALEQQDSSITTVVTAVLVSSSGSSSKLLLYTNKDEENRHTTNSFHSASSSRSSSPMMLRTVDILNQHKQRQKQKQIHVQQQQRAQGYKEDSSAYSSFSENDPVYNDVQELYHTQHLDHFNAANFQYTFQQRYFYSDRYVSSSNDDDDDHHQRYNDTTSHSQQQELAFLCVGGEGPYMDKSILVDSPHCTGDMLYTAERLMNHATTSLKIHLFALEHRYYGESYPTEFPNMNNNNTNVITSPVSNEHLVYLSSRQSLADLAHFVSQPQYRNYQWIVFGASYPGVLAAWSRYHYPHLIHSAISHSAPIQSQLDMAVYHNHVAKVLANPNVGGSTLCLQIYTRGHEQIITAIQKNSTNMAEKLNLCNSSALLDRKNIQLLIGDGILYPGTQENDPSCTGYLCNIEKKCTALIEHYNQSLLLLDNINNNNNTNDGTLSSSSSCDCTREMDALISVTTSFNHFNNDFSQNFSMSFDFDDSRNFVVHDDDSYTTNEPSCFEVDWLGTLDYIRDPDLGMDEGLRSWLWQTCTEFGFYQTCEINSTCPYARGYHPLSQDLEICQIAFGIDNVAELIQDTIVWSGGWKLRTSGISRIVSVTGTVDPWSELALQNVKVSTSSMPIYQVPDASHHFWTHPVQATDGPMIEAARDYVYTTVQNFIQQKQKEEVEAEYVTQKS